MRGVGDGMGGPGRQSIDPGWASREWAILAAPDNRPAMHGLHLTADLGGCPPHLPTLCEPQALRQACVAAVEAAGLTPVAELFHAFVPLPGQAEPAGVTGVVLLAESHLAVHTWPERGGVTLDVYVCNLGADNSARAEALMDHLLALFEPAQVQRQRLWRGGDRDLVQS